MRWRWASFGLAFLAVAAVSVAVAIAVRAGGPAQPLAASTATVAPEAAPTAGATPVDAGGGQPDIGRASPPPPPTPVPGIVVSGPEPAPLGECLNGTVVANPLDNRGLVSDCSALLQAKDTLRGTAALNWSSGLAIASWDGVGAGDRVGRIHLGGKGLSGTIPAQLGDLAGLRYLNLGGNRLTGGIPEELGNLTGLTHLFLAGNRLTGTVPDLSANTGLEVLNLRNNQLDGGVPAWPGGLTRLKRLLLNGNQLTGPIPAELGALAQARMSPQRRVGELRLSGNALTGCVPPLLRTVPANDMASLSLADCTPTPTPTPAPSTVTPTATPPPIPQVELGDFLEGGGTYALPGGTWIFDVPEGMRLWHNGDEPGRNPGDPPNGFGFMDRVTGSLITIYLRPDGSLDFYGFNYGSTPAARELADAWLPAIEASVRRPPGFVEPAASGEAVAGPGANPAGVPYLRGYGIHEEVFAGGRTYATPDDKWLVDVPAGISVRFHQNTQAMPFGGEAVDTYGFDTVDAVGTWSSIYINKTTGKFAGRIGAVNSQMDALAASFRKP